MDLVQAAQQLKEEHDKKTAAIAAREAELGTREANVKAAEDSIAGVQQELDQREAKIKEVEDVAALKEAITAKEQSVRTMQDSLADQMASLRVKENQLADAAAANKQKEQEILVREQEQTKRETTYKDTLKEEFFNQIQKNLPQS